MLARNSALNNLPMTLEDLFSNIVEKLRAFHKIALSTACKFSNEAHNPVPLNKAVHITFSAPERYVILIDAPFLQPQKGDFQTYVTQLGNILIPRQVLATSRISRAISIQTETQKIYFLPHAQSILRTKTCKISNAFDKFARRRILLSNSAAKLHDSIEIIVALDKIINTAVPFAKLKNRADPFREPSKSKCMIHSVTYSLSFVSQTLTRTSLPLISLNRRNLKRFASHPILSCNTLTSQVSKPLVVLFSCATCNTGIYSRPRLSH